ncbi:MAG: hypothetical protein WD048_04925, partial [Chitinophagales bacterium]
LHVLSLPLAFILSQDQTLRCKKSLIIFARLDAVSYIKSKNFCFLLVIFNDLFAKSGHKDNDKFSEHPNHFSKKD